MNQDEAAGASEVRIEANLRHRNVLLQVVVAKERAYGSDHGRVVTGFDG